ncbi:MAG: SDR family NAD(P)-dependent oxidoreductase [Thalassospira sp.]|uniref:SDR family oxidoreductase n=1 Tax=Thalassospira sp. TaxID=1912094 RepID=UPI0032EF858F
MTKQTGIVLITGATSGIGLELLRIYHAQGVEIVAHGRSEQKLAILQDQYPDLHIVKADLSDPDAINAMMRDVLNAYPDIRLIFNNAAIQERGVLTDDGFDPDVAQREIAINLFAPIGICHAFIAKYANSNRPRPLSDPMALRIVNISSGLAFFPKTSGAIYCASKAALHSLSQSLRYQLAAAGIPIAISEVFLPVVDTPMTEGRKMRKISARKAALAIHDGIDAGLDEIYVGKARWIPIITRLSPSLMKSILRNG